MTELEKANQRIAALEAQEVELCTLYGIVQAENGKLRAELAAIGAGGVSGPLMGEQSAPKVSDAQRALHELILNRLSHAELLEKAHYLMELNSNQGRTIGELQDLVALTAQAPSQPGGFSSGDMASAAAGGYRDGWAAAQAISAEPAAHVQNPAENEHVADDMSKNRAELNMSTQAVAQQGAAYAALPEPLEIDWPELHSQALGCGVEDRGLHNRYECAEYGWQDGVDKCAERVPEQIFDADQMLAFADATCALRPSHGQALRLLTQKERDSLGRRAEGMDGNEWDQWVQEKFAQVNGLKVQGGSYEWDWE